MLIHLKDEDFNEEIKSGVVLVDFYADWCGPCKMLGPILEEISNENNNVKIVKINVDSHEDLARQYGIMSIPTILVFKDGKEIHKNIGFVSKDEIDGWLKL